MRPHPPGGPTRPARLATPASLRAIASGSDGDRAAPDAPGPPPGRALVRTPTPTTAMRAIGAQPSDGDETTRAARGRRDDETARATGPRPSDPPTVPDGLHDAVRVGLALLDPPGVAARSAVRRRTLDDAMPAIAAHAGLVAPPAGAASVPGAAALVVALLALALMPSPRTVLLVTALGVAWLWWRRRARPSRLLARDPLPDRATTVDRRIG